MTDHFAWGLQKAIYQHLTSDDALKVLLGNPPRLYDAPPRDAVFPYAALGESRVKDWPGVDGGLEHDIRVHVFSRYQGRREVKDVLNAVYDALHEAALTIEGRRLVQIRFTFSDIFPRNNNGVFQGAARFRAVTERAT